jgi:general secretion pathway protein H
LPGSRLNFHEQIVLNSQVNSLDSEKSILSHCNIAGPALLPTERWITPPLLGGGRARVARLSGHPRRSLSPGFTFIETIVVLVILGLALTIVAGFLPRRNTTSELTGATTRVAGALRVARSRAMVQSRPVQFVVAPDGHGFRLDNAAVILAPAVAISMPEPRLIVFAPDGSASGGSLRVSMNGQQRVIRVDWLTGRVIVAGP